MLPNTQSVLPPQPEFSIREFTDQEIDLLNQMKKFQGFRIGVHDFTAFKELDNYEFLTAVSSNETVGFLGSVVYDSGLAYLGSYFVKKQFRGQGFGWKLWNHVLSKLKGNNWGLNSTHQQSQNYKKSGFKTQSQGIRYRFKGTNMKYESKFLFDCKEVAFDKLNKYDRQNFPGSRPKFLAALIRQPRCKAIAFVRNNKIEGYGVMRVTPFGYKIGPMIADNYEVAVQILKGLRSQAFQQDEIFIQTARPHQDVLKLALQFQMEKVFTYMRMFTNGEPQIFKKKTIYSITSPEFG